jgi:hypothetical protein
MSVGRDLLDVPFADMVRSLAMAVADGQRALDKSSMETARFLAEEQVNLIDEMAEVIEPRPFNVDAGEGGTIRVTGATVRREEEHRADYTLLQAGLFPTFYQFTESVIEVKMSISHKTTSSQELTVGARLSVGWGPVAFSASVNFKSSQTYSYSAEGSSLLRTTLKPVPPPARLTPRIITINTLPMLQGGAPTVTVA